MQTVGQEEGQEVKPVKKLLVSSFIPICYFTGVYTDTGKVLRERAGFILFSALLQFSKTPLFSDIKKYTRIQYKPHRESLVDRCAL